MFTTGPVRRSSQRRRSSRTVTCAVWWGCSVKPSGGPRLGTGLWIVPSRGVHTIGMMFPIDLVFLSKDKEVVHVGGIRAAVSHLQSFLESVQRPGTAAAHDLSDRDEGRRSTGDFLARPANRGPGAGHFLRRLGFLERRIVVDAVYEIYRNTSCRIYVRHARGHVHFSRRSLALLLMGNEQLLLRWKRLVKRSTSKTFRTFSTH